MKTQWSIIVALLFSLLVALFAILNTETVTINLLFRTVDISAVLVILGSAAAGALIVTFFSFVRNVQVTREMRELKKEIKKLEEELENQPKPSLNEEKVLLPEISLNEEGILNRKGTHLPLKGDVSPHIRREGTTEKNDAAKEEDMAIPTSK